MLLGLWVAMPLLGKTTPYRLPELLPPASDPKPSAFSDWGNEDPEVFVRYFEKYQASLSDYDRVRLLSEAAERSIRPDAHPSFSRSGPARALIAFALRAARGAENHDTFNLRRLRVRLAWRIHPDVGHRETEETLAEIEVISVRTVPILLRHDQSQDSSDGRKMRSRIQEWGESIRRENPNFTKRKVSGKLPRLAELPLGDPHTKSMSGHRARIAYSLEGVHQQHVSDFVGQKGFGVSRAETIIDQRQAYRDRTGRDWRVTQAQLVSFLEREEPVAYQMEKDQAAGILGPRSELNSKTVPTRPLSAFEKSAFAKSLQTGKPEFLESPKLIKAVAPILAEASCMRCHDVDLGDPLGAFSYELMPEAMAELPKMGIVRLENEPQD
jgi:hypothetical protein